MMISMKKYAIAAVLALLPVAASAEVLVPFSTLTRPADTNNYAQNDLIASSVTAGSVVVPFLTVASGNWTIPRLRLRTNVTTGWGSATLRIRLWMAAPTYTNGDNGAYAVATGSLSFVGACDIQLEQDADGARGSCAPSVGSAWSGIGVKLYWDLQDTTVAALVPIASQTFTLTAEVLK